MANVLKTESIDIYVIGNQEQFEQPSEHNDKPAEGNSLHTLQRWNNRDPSLLVDPEIKRKEKQLQKKIEFITKLMWITLSISIVSILLLLIHWIYSSR